MPNENAAVIEAPEQEAERTSMQHAFDSVFADEKPHPQSVKQPQAAPKPVDDAHVVEDKAPPVETQAGDIPAALFEQPKETQKPDDFEELMKLEKPVKGQDHFGKVKAAAAKYHTEAETLRKELDALKTAAPAAMTDKERQEFEAARTRAQELEKELETVSVERSGKFRSWQASEQSNLTAAKSYLDGSDVAPHVVEAAASVTGAARLKALRESGMDAETISAVMPHLAAVDAARQTMNQMRENATAERTAIEAEEKARGEQGETARKQEYEQAFKKVTTDIFEKYDVFRNNTGDAKWDARANQFRADAAKVFSGDAGSVEAMARVAAVGVIGEAQNEYIGSLKKMLSDAQATIKQLKGSEPGAGVQGGGGKSATVDASVPWEDAVMAKFRAAQNAG